MLSLSDINVNLLDSEYAVRGTIVDRADELSKKGQKIIYCNIGNPQAFGQKPLSYIRQTISLLQNPKLINLSALEKEYPKDIIRKAKDMLLQLPSGMGAYTSSMGIPFVRERIAEFITERDGIPSNADHIIMTDGCGRGVQGTILALLKNPNDGIMVPVPQYPLYSASIQLFGGKEIPYDLHEEKNWGMSEEALNTSIEAARNKGIHPIAIVVINPGNPTGSVLNRTDIETVIRFAAKNKLAILSDEVYQENIYDPQTPFISVAKVMHEIGEDSVPLFSYHSTSKGLIGECGQRGGYMEIRNVAYEALQQLVKLQSINLCANTVGQIIAYLMVTPPVSGEESYETYQTEHFTILENLREKSVLIGQIINSIPGMSVVTPRGAMYAFVHFELPNMHSTPLTQTAEYLAQLEERYCLDLLEKTGLCVVPGSGFGQAPGTMHFRMTILPPREELEDICKKIAGFHMSYSRELQPV